MAQVSLLLGIVHTSRGNTGKKKNYFSHLLGVPDLWEEKNQRKQNDIAVRDFGDH